MTTDVRYYLPRLPDGCYWLDQLITKNEHGHEKVVEDIFDRVTPPGTALFRGEVTDESNLIAIIQMEDKSVFTIEAAVEGFWVLKYANLHSFFRDELEGRTSYATLERAVQAFCSFLGVDNALYGQVRTKLEAQPVLQMKDPMVAKTKPAKRPDSFGAFS